MGKKRICIIASSPEGIVAFHKTNIDKLSEKFDIYIVANFKDASMFSRLKIKGAQSINIERKPTVISVLKAIYQLIKYFKAQNIDAFLSMSISASLIAAVAGKIANVPFRARIFTGQIWANKKGLSRLFFKTLDKLTIVLNNHFLVDGKSQQEFLIRNGILEDKQSVVLANGSICGVDLDRFRPSFEIRERERLKLDLKDSDVVFSFMGRINRDKGIYELFSAFNRLASEKKNVKLLLIGCKEGISYDLLNTYEHLYMGKNVISYGFTKTPYYALQAGDIFCLPSYREGFGMSVIEAAALELPIIASDAYGLRDSFVDGQTGLKCKMKDCDSLYTAMNQLYEDKSIRKKMGKNGRERVKLLFSKELVSTAWLTYFEKNL